MDEKAKILVVDDDPDLLLATAKLLRAAGHDVIEASSGRDAVAAARKHQPDVVLLDVVLPDLDGMEVCQQIKRDPCCARTFVVLVSGLLTTSDALADGLEVGADSYIARPVPNRELLARVDSMIRIQGAERALRESEARFRTIVETAPSLLMIADVEGNIVYASPNCAEIVGYTQDKLPGPPKWWVHPDDLDRAREAYERSSREGTGAKNFEYKAVKKDGTVWYASSSWEPLCDDQGRLAGVVLQTIDVTEQKQVEEALQQSRERYRRIVETAYEGIWILDERGRTSFVNRRMADMLGYSPDEMMDLPLFSFIDEQWREAAAAKLGRRRKGVTEQHDFNFRRKDGTDLWVIVSASPIFDEKGEYAGALGMITDITDRKRAEQSVRESEAFARSTLDGLSAHIAILDAQGVIQAVNKAWSEFAQANPVAGPVCEGASYLEICDRASGPGAQDAFRFARGVRAVLAGERAAFHLEYPCHSPDKQRWFVGRVTRFPGEGPPRVVVAHENITERKRAEERLRKSHDELEKRVRERTAELDERLRFEKILSELSATFINLPVSEVDGEIERALRRLVEFLGVDRGGVFRFDTQSQQFLATHAWTRNGIEPVPGSVEMDRLPWIAGRLQSNQVVCFGRREELPDAAGVDLQSLRALGVRAMASVPLVVAGSPFGSMSFVSLRAETTWSEGLVQRLRLAGEIFANALVRKQMEEDLQGKTRGLAEAQRMAHLGNWEWDLVANELAGSDEVYRIFGLEPQAFGVTYKAFLDLVHPADRGNVEDAVNRALHDPGEAYSIEHRIVLPDGTARVVHGRAEVTFDEAGRPVRMIGTVQDVTERKRAEEALRQSEARFRRVLNTSPDAIILLSRDGTISYASEAAGEMFGFRPEELVGRKIETLIPERFRDDPASRRQGYFTAALAAQQAGTGTELYGLRHDGREFPCEIRLNPLEPKGWAVVLCLIRDISERRRSEEEAEVLRAELAHVARAETMGELAASLAHEINQPLTAILTNAQAAQRFLAAGEPDLEEVRDALADIIEADWRAGEVIRRMRTLLKKGDLEKTPQDINRLVQEVVPLVRSEALVRGVVMELDLTSNLPPVSGDRVQLQQVILNLAVNGMEAMEAVEERQRRLMIRTSHSGSDGVEIAVSDHGTGLAPDLVERIFEPFYTTKSEGMGMGLSISASIVEAHGGRIWAENNPDRGACLLVTLPVGRPPSGDGPVSH